MMSKPRLKQNYYYIFFLLCRYEWLGSNLLSVVGLVFLTFHISDLLTKFVFNILPHRLIKNTSDKAVLITGKPSIQITIAIQIIFSESLHF